MNVLKKPAKNEVRLSCPLFLARSLTVAVSVFLASACGTQHVQTTNDAASAERGYPQEPVSARPGAMNAQEESSLQVPDILHRIHIRKWASQQDRLYKVASPLLLKNAGVCKKKTRQTTGFVARNKFSYSKDLAEVAEQELHFSDRLQVTNIMPDSAAEKAGLQTGDIVLGIDGHDIPAGANAERKAAALTAAAIRQRGSIALTLQRDGNRIALDIPAARICAFDVELGNADYVNAYSDGQRSLITMGMLGYARTDSELAIVVAKEIAHNIVMQRPRPHIAQTIDHLRVAGPVAKIWPDSTKIRPYTAVMDATADKYSLYLLARAGHDVDKVLPFWKRLANDHPATQENSYTALHPSTAYRFSVISAVSRVVKHHQKHSLPLVPH